MWMFTWKFTLAPQQEKNKTKTKKERNKQTTKTQTKPTFRIFERFSYRLPETNFLALSEGIIVETYSK